MAQQIADRRDVDFVLYEQLEMEELIKHERYSDMNRKMFDMIITEARNFAIKEILPLNEEGDRIGLVFENNQVKVPECFHRPYKLLNILVNLRALSNLIYRLLNIHERPQAMAHTFLNRCL